MYLLPPEQVYPKSLPRQFDYSLAPWERQILLLVNLSEHCAVRRAEEMRCGVQ